MGWPRSKSWLRKAQTHTHHDFQFFCYIQQTYWFFTGTDNVHWTIRSYHSCGNHIMDLLLLMCSRNPKTFMKKNCSILCYLAISDKISQIIVGKKFKQMKKQSEYVCQIIYLFIGKLQTNGANERAIKNIIKVYLFSIRVYVHVLISSVLVALKRLSIEFHAG